MWRVLVFCMPTACLADSLIATRVIGAQEILSAEDMVLVAADIPGALTDPVGAIGQETRIAIYPGRPIRVQDIGAAALIERNQMISLIFQTGSLAILTEGRALDRGGVGDVIEVMNLSSRNKVSGRVGQDGAVHVSPSP